MKKLLFLLSLVITVFLPEASFCQVRPSNQQARSTFNNRNNAVRSMPVFVPRPQNINFIGYRKQFTKGNARASNSFAAAVSRLKGGNTSPLNGAVKTMSPVRTGSNNIHTSLSNMEQSLIPPVVKRTQDGHSVTYFLKRPGEIADWKEGAEYNAKIAATSATSFDNNKKMNCHTTTLTFNARSTSFMNAQSEMQGSNILPGMIFDFDDLSKGNFNQKENVNRAPVALVSDAYNAGSVSADIADPNRESLANGMKSLVTNFGGNPGGAHIQMQITKTENAEQLAIVTAAGGSYGAFTGSGSFSHSQSSYHVYYTIDAVKSLYTFSVMPKTSSLYNPGAAIPPGFPVMIQDVTFGARVLANVDIELSAEDNAGNLDLNYNDGVESAWTKFKAAVSSKKAKVTINGLLVGFPQRFPGTFSCNPDDFLNTINNFFSGCDYISAKPIQYALVNLDGDYMGIESITDKTTIQECTPANETFTLQSVVAVFSTGEDDKNRESEFWLSLSGGDPLHPRWFAQFYDNHTEYKRDGNPYQVVIPITAPITETELNNGGFVALKLIEHHGGNDDWDFQNMDIILNFKSESGTPKTKKLSLGSFKIHDTKVSRYDSKQVIFQSNGTDGYVPTQ